MEITYFVHGSTLDNERKTASGWEQTPLSQKGIEQTIAASHSIKDEQFEKIFVSDLRRAIESANILFSKCKKPFVVDMRLRECNYGIMTKKSNEKLFYNEHIYDPFPQGECLIDVERRMRSFLNDIMLLGHKRIAIVSHRAPQLALDVIISEISWEVAIQNDWREVGCWKPGWSYTYSI